ncbi:MAG: hypothetical protein P1V21_26895 [Rhizobiaceae bacterium]|nr:hypothetical protein [Rhizobiaceae bacterium]
MTFVPFDNADKIVDEFIAMLKSRGIDPLIRGQIEEEFLTLTELLHIWKNPSSLNGREKEVLCTAAGVHDFAAKVLAAGQLPEFDSFRDHLELISKGTLQTNMSQMSAGAPDDAARKLVELYVACLAIHCGENIALDHPVNSKGDNPDVLLDYGSKRWAIAIKTISTTQGQTIFENIKKAADQIERSSANRGLVLLNVKNSINHERLWQENFSCVKEATDALRVEIEALINAADHNRPDSDWEEIFSGEKTALPVLMMGQSVVSLPTPASEKTPTPIKMMVACSFDRVADSDGLQLANCLCHSMQVIL